MKLKIYEKQVRRVICLTLLILFTTNAAQAKPKLPASAAPEKWPVRLHLAQQASKVMRFVDFDSVVRSGESAQIRYVLAFREPQGGVTFTWAIHSFSCKTQEGVVLYIEEFDVTGHRLSGRDALATTKPPPPNHFNAKLIEWACNPKPTGLATKSYHTMPDLLKEGVVQ